MSSIEDKPMRDDSQRLRDIAALAAWWYTANPKYMGLNKGEVAALEGSIKDWEERAAGKDGLIDCACCNFSEEQRDASLLHHDEYQNACFGCPIFNYTGQQQCGDTPHDDWVSACNEQIRSESDTDFSQEMFDAAAKEVAFLKEVLAANGMPRPEQVVVQGENIKTALTPLGLPPSMRAEGSED